MAPEFEVMGEGKDAPFTLKVRRGEGMAMLTMDWDGKPPDDFVGFAIEFQAPGDDKFSALPNRISFPKAVGA